MLHPLSSYLLHRGLQTLPLRVRHQSQNAQKLVDRLLANPAVERVYYPGLAECDPQHLVGRQMSGPGAVFAMAVRGGYDAAARVADSVRLITHAVSLGGVDTLIQHPASLTHRPVAADAKPHASVLRISVGLGGSGGPVRGSGAGAAVVVRDRIGIPGVLWSPASGADRAPLILLGHGGGNHKKHPAMAGRARLLVLGCGFHVACHGSRPRARCGSSPGTSALLRSH